MGESTQTMYDIIDAVEPHMPGDKPRYLMGVGTPSNIIEAVARGGGFFDCDMPARHARPAWQEHVRYARQGPVRYARQETVRRVRQENARHVPQGTVRHARQEIVRHVRRRIVRYVRPERADRPARTGVQSPDSPDRINARPAGTAKTDRQEAAGRLTQSGQAVRREAAAISVPVLREEEMTGGIPAGMRWLLR